MSERLAYLSFLPFACVLLATFLGTLLFFPDKDRKRAGESTKKRPMAKMRSTNDATTAIWEGPGGIGGMGGHNDRNHHHHVVVTFAENDKRTAALEHLPDDEEKGITAWQRNLSSGAL